MSIPRSVTDGHPSLSEWCILSGYVGSVSHGTYRPPGDKTSTDDKDVMAFCVPSPQYYLGLREFGSRGTQEIKRDEWDIVIYEARKAIRLLLQGNPNVLCMLWLAPQYRLATAPAGQLLIDHRGAFVGKHVYQSFVGYARGQLHRMTHGAHLGYMGEKRKALVEEFGYDTKNASHLIRLLRMAIEFLGTGELQVERSMDASELVDIKRGRWSLIEVQSEASRLFADADRAFIASELPPRPDRDTVGRLCEDIIRLHWLGVRFGQSPNDTWNADSARSPRQGLVEGKESEDG